MFCLSGYGSIASFLLTPTIFSLSGFFVSGVCSRSLLWPLHRPFCSCFILTVIRGVVNSFLPMTSSVSDFDAPSCALAGVISNDFSETISPQVWATPCLVISLLRLASFRLDGPVSADRISCFSIKPSGWPVFSLPQMTTWICSNGFGFSVTLFNCSKNRLTVWRCKSSSLPERTCSGLHIPYLLR